VTFSLDYKIKLVAGSDIDLQKVLDDLKVVGIHRVHGQTD
jgi:hypothetical protein